MTQRSVSGPHQTAAGPALGPYFGAEFDRKDFFDLSFGGRLRIYKTLVGTAGFLYALNDDGLRSSVLSPYGGFEATF